MATIKYYRCLRTVWTTQFTKWDFRNSTHSQNLQHHGYLDARISSLGNPLSNITEHRFTWICKKLTSWCSHSASVCRFPHMQQILHYNTDIRDIIRQTPLTNAILSSRCFNSVHFCGLFVVRSSFRCGVWRPLQLVDGVFVVNGFAGSGASPQPAMVQRLGRRHPLGRIPLETTGQKVDEERILTAAECLGKVSGCWWASVLSTVGSAARQLVASARTCRQWTVPRKSPRADEVSRSFADIE